MGAEKHVMPILIIVLVLVALISTYAWFTSATTSNVVVDIAPGAPTAFAITEGTGAGGAYEYGGAGDEDASHKYSGQKGVDSNGNIITSALDKDKPYILYAKVPFAVSGASQMTFVVNMDKLIVEVGDRYTYTLAQTFDLMLHLNAEDYDTPEEQATYYVTKTAYDTDNSVTPTSGNPIYVVYNTSTSKVTHIIYTSSVISQYMTYDYWLSTAEAVEPVEDHDSGIEDGGINYVDNGETQYMCVMIAFYGYNSSTGRYIPCAFSSTKFRGSSFKFIMSAGGV